MRSTLLTALAAPLPLAGPALAQGTSPELDACKASGLIALKQRQPAIKSVEVDPDTVSVSKVNVAVEQTPVRTIVLGLATIDTARKEKPNQFVCLIGDKGKVLLTFFTEK